MQADDLRKLAAQLRNKDKEVKREKAIKSAMYLRSNNGLMILKRKLGRV